MVTTRGHIFGKIFDLPNKRFVGRKNHWCDHFRKIICISFFAYETKSSIRMLQNKLTRTTLILKCFVFVWKKIFLILYRKRLLAINIVCFVTPMLPSFQLGCKHQSSELINSHVINSAKKNILSSSLTKVQNIHFK